MTQTSPPLKNVQLIGPHAVRIGTEMERIPGPHAFPALVNVPHAIWYEFLFQSTDFLHPHNVLTSSMACSSCQQQMLTADVRKTAS